MIKRAPRAPRNRTRLPAVFQPTAPALIATAAINTGKVRVTTNLPYVYAAIPATFTVQGVGPTALTPISPTVFDLTYAVTPVTTNVFQIHANDPGVRGQAGGFVAAATTTF